tara:strand:- start:826 stop:996 length:171 start_codon:yes stop_codon:yes gene_type:complete
MEKIRKRISEIKNRMNEIWEQYDHNGSVEDLSEFEQLVIELYELENSYPIQNISIH